MKVLIIKTSSMGDVIHTLPALNDAKQAIPGIKFDWVVEPSFSEIVKWELVVDQAIIYPFRTWRGRWGKALYSGEVLRFIRQLRKQKYDYVIDAQGLIKSAVICLLAKAKHKSGYSWHACRESLASIFYSNKVNIIQKQHAIYRVRELFAKTLNYKLTGKPSYDINWQQFEQSIDKPYLFFLHGTTWASKHWPAGHWYRLAELADKSGYIVKVTWATPEQKQRALQLGNLPNVEVLPHLTINQAAEVVRNSAAVIAVDTGFVHLAAAMSIPAVAIHGPTDPTKTGITNGQHQIDLNSSYTCSPCFKRDCIYGKVAKCMESITPETVWQTLTNVINN